MMHCWPKCASTYNSYVRLIDRSQTLMRLENLFSIFEHSVFSDKRCVKCCDLLKWKTFELLINDSEETHISNFLH